MLAVVFGLQKFKCYLGASPFQLITDSRAVTYLRSTRNFSAKLARMSLFVSEFNFEVKHRAGKVHSNADGLTRSRREGTDSNFPDVLAEVNGAETAALSDAAMDDLADEMVRPLIPAACPGEGTC